MPLVLYVNNICSVCLNCIVFRLKHALELQHDCSELSYCRLNMWVYENILVLVWHIVQKSHARKLQFITVIILFYLKKQFLTLSDLYSHRTECLDNAVYYME